MASITITHDMFAALSDVARAELVKMLTTVPGVAVPVAPAPVSAAPVPTADAAPPSKGRKKKDKKPVDPDAPPKEKRAPNSWILFSGHVEKLIRHKELVDGTPKESKMRTVTVKQFASHLKHEKPVEGWADDAILAALSTWTPPVKAEPTVPADAPAADATETATPAADATGTAAAPTPLKKRGPKKLADMSPEERAAHDAKIAERKAKKDASAAAPSSPTPSEKAKTD